jgi:nitrogen fixation protein
MSDIIDINVGETIEEVTINVVDNLITVNINKVTGGGGTQTLAETLDLGNTTGGENISISNGDAIILDNGSMLKKGTIDAGNGGSKGISQICGVGYEHKWEAGRLYIMNDGGTIIREVSHNLTYTPTATDDVTKGFVQNTRWILDNGDVYVCTDPTEGAAVWEFITGAVPTLQQVTTEGNETNNPIKVIDDGNSLTELRYNGLYFEDLVDNGTTILRFLQTSASDQQIEIRGEGGTMALLSDIPSSSTFVPYTGATTNVDLGEYELKAGQIELDTTPTGTAGVAVTRWNDTIGSSETTLKGGSVILKNGVDLVARVVNKVTPNTTLTKAAYQVVKVSGAQGQRLAVNLAQGNTDLNSADTLGIVTETIAANQEGFIITVGQLEGINTTGSLQGETWADGDVLYLSPTTAGRITNIKPNGSTGHIVVIGYVEYAHANNGKIYVKIMNGWELDELHNVFIDTPLNNQALTYESSTDLWKNKTIIEDSITNGVTDKAPSQNAVFDALALKQNIVSLYNLTSQITHTGTTAKTLLLTYFIPANTFTNGDFLNFSALVTKAANIGSTTHTIEINTTNTLTGATIITTAGFNTTNLSLKLKREIALTGGNGYVLNISNNTQNDQTINAAANTMPTFTYNLAADLYLFVTCQLTNATDSITYRGVSITKN